MLSYCAYIYTDIKKTREEKQSQASTSRSLTKIESGNLINYSLCGYKLQMQISIL